jgi:hypothetical protein
MVVAKQLQENSRSRPILDECRVESGQRFELSDMLKVPFQRILKYPLLLRELWKKTPETHFDKSGLEVSLAGIKTVTQLINARKAESEKVVALLARARGSYSGKPAHMLGQVLHEGSCGMPVGRVLGSTKVEARQLYLFSETLLIFKAVTSKSRRLSTKLGPSKQRSASDGDASPYDGDLTFKSAVPLNAGTNILDLRAWELPSMPSARADEWTAGWKIETGSTALTFVAPAIEQRHWGELLRERVRENGGAAAGPTPTPRESTKLNGLRWEMPREAVELIEVIGEEGFFGKVYRGLLCKSTDVAVKTFTPGLISTAGLLKEMATFAGLQHPHMLQFYCMVSDPDTSSIWMVTELLTNGSLLQYLRLPDTPSTFPLHRLTELARQVADGMAYLESKRCPSACVVRCFVTALFL